MKKGTIKFNNDIGLRPEEKEMITQIVETTRQIYAEEAGNLMPKFFVTNSKSKSMGIIAGMFGNQKEKEMFAAAVKKIVLETKSDGVMGVLESWTIPPESAKDFMENRDKYPTVSDHPDAYDCVYFSYENRFGTWMVSAKCDERDGTFETELTFIRADEAHGLLANMIHLKEILN